MPPYLIHQRRFWALLTFYALYIMFVQVKSQEISRADRQPDHNLAEKHIPFSELVKLIALNVSEAAQKVTCTSSTPCKYRTFYGMKVTPTSLVDNERRILMEFSPKADCTAAIVMFLREMGFRYGIEFTGWPHTFRDKFFNAKCGKATPCVYYSQDWFRFKIVRNPWDRAVSSYIHVMKYPELREKVISPKDRQTLTFAKFVTLLEKLSPKELQGFAGAHSGLQSQPYERLSYGTNVSVFHEIVQAENAEESLQRINRRLGTNYTKVFRGHHFAERRNDINHYVGNVPWNQLQDNIPSNYGLFYNHELRLRVHQLYLWDILLYNYSFPFTLAHLIPQASSNDSQPSS
eukprot:gene8291-8968_t